MMGLPALACGWFFHKFKGTNPDAAGVYRGGGRALGTAMAAVILALLLMTGGEDFFGVAKIALVAHVPVFIIEGVVSTFTIGFLFRVKPALLRQSHLGTTGGRHG